MSWSDRLRPALSDRRFIALWALGVFLDLPLLWLVLGQKPLLPGWLTAVLHLAAAVAMFLAPPKDRGWFQTTRHWGEPMGLISLVIPGAGPLIAGLLLTLHPQARHDKESYLFEDDASDQANPLAALGTPAAIREEMAQALDVVPAADALLGRDPSYKRGAITVLARIRSAESIAWILKARTDPDPETRFYAVSALTQLKRDFDIAIQAAQREAYSRPGDLGPQMSLQRVRYEYAHSGLLDPSTADAVLRQCREWLQRPAERDQEALRLLYLVERDIDPPRALQLLERLERGDSGSGLRWVRERTVLLFELGRFAEFHRLVQARREELLRDEGAMSQAQRAEWRAAVLWWTHG